MAGRLRRGPWSVAPATEDELEERSWVVGLLFLTGALLVVGGLATGLYDQGRPDVIWVVVASASVLGGGAVLLRRRLPAWVHPAMVATGSIAVAVIVYFAGPAGAGPGSTYLVFVACYSYYYFAPGAASIEWGWGALAHAAALLLAGHDAAIGQWMTINGAALVAGGLLGRLGGRARRLAIEQGRLRAQLALADETKTTFLRAIGHELRGPLATSSGFATTLRDRGDDLDDADRQQLLARLVGSIDRLQGALDDLLRFGELTDGIIRLQMQEVELRDIIDRAIAESQLEPERVEVRAAPTTIVADEGKLVRAVANLLGNAAKYTPRESPVTVFLAQDAPAGMVLIAVEDRGPGVPPEARERIFRPLVRLDGANEVEGTGIGLSLVQQIARLHAGSCHVEEGADGGARFCILLPRRPANAAVDGVGDGAPTSAQ